MPSKFLSLLADRGPQQDLPFEAHRLREFCCLRLEGAYPFDSARPVVDDAVVCEGRTHEPGDAEIRTSECFELLVPSIYELVCIDLEIFKRELPLRRVDRVRSERK